jgi:hypothetical protein
MRMNITRLVLWLNVLGAVVQVELNALMEVHSELESVMKG